LPRRGSFDLEPPGGENFCGGLDILWVQAQQLPDQKKNKLFIDSKSPVA